MKVLDACSTGYFNSNYSCTETKITFEYEGHVHWLSLKGGNPRLCAELVEKAKTPSEARALIGECKIVRPDMWNMIIE